MYDADGKNPSTAVAPLPFPGLRELSMVLKVGTQTVQGGTDVTFTTTGQKGRGAQVRPPGRWGHPPVIDAAAVTALLDRLLHHAHVLGRDIAREAPGAVAVS